MMYWHGMPPVYAMTTQLPWGTEVCPFGRSANKSWQSRLKCGPVAVAILLETPAEMLSLPLVGLTMAVTCCLVKLPFTACIAFSALSKLADVSLVSAAAAGTIRSCSPVDMQMQDGVSASF